MSRKARPPRPPLQSLAAAPKKPVVRRPAAALVEEFCKLHGIALAKGTAIEKTGGGGLITHPVIDFVYIDEIKQPEQVSG